MNGGVDHDSAVDVDLDDLSLLLDISHTLVGLVVNALQRDKFLAPSNELCSELLFILMILQGEAVQTGNLSCSLESWNFAFHGT